MPDKKFQKIVVTGMLLREGKVLLVRRGMHEKFLPGKYEMPGGKVDFGEEPEISLAREFQEEVGLEVSVVEPFYTFAYVTDGGNRHTVEIVYLVKLKDEDNFNVSLGKDHDDFIWADVEAVDKLDYPQEDSIYKALKKGFEFYGPVEGIGSCEDCESCQDCEDCGDSMDCGACKNCEDCGSSKDSKDCDDCKNCEGSQDCEDCKDGRDFADCKCCADVKKSDESCCGGGCC